MNRKLGIAHAKSLLPIVFCFPAGGPKPSWNAVGMRESGGNRRSMVMFRHGHFGSKMDPGSDPVDLDPRSTGIIYPPFNLTEGSTGIIDPIPYFVMGSTGIKDPGLDFTMRSTGIIDPWQNFTMRSTQILDHCPCLTLSNTSTNVGFFRFSESRPVNSLRPAPIFGLAIWNEPTGGMWPMHQDPSYA